MLDGQVMLVTGAGNSRGIGAAVALRAAAEGASAVAVADVDADGAAAVAASVEAAGCRALGLGVDVRDRQSVQRAVLSVERTFGRIDILVNGAGVMRPTPVLEISETEWDQIQIVNLRGAFFCIQAALPGMIERRYGRIVNVASVSAKRGKGVLGGAHYAASKAGLLGLTKAVAQEASAFGVTCNAVCPGVIVTDMVRGMTPQQEAKVIQMTPNRRLGRAEDVAAAVCFLASPSAGHITGEDIDVNGGFHID